MPVAILAPATTGAAAAVGVVPMAGDRVPAGVVIVLIPALLPLGRVSLSAGTTVGGITGVLAALPLPNTVPPMIVVSLPVGSRTLRTGGRPLVGALAPTAPLVPFTPLAVDSLSPGPRSFGPIAPGPLVLGLPVLGLLVLGLFSLGPIPLSPSHS